MRDRPLGVPAAADVAARFRRHLEGGGSTDGRSWSGPDDVMALLLELLRSNLEQWRLEDVTRSPASGDAAVARAKRSIDRLNRGRHELVERIDALVASAVVQSSTAPPATESPAMAFDRLSVLAIRLDRTARAAAAGAAGEALTDRLPVLVTQVDALAQAIDALLDDVRAGRRRFVPYEHLKLYPAEGAPARRAGGTRPG
jgi:hypothetical protein